jgi:hypothetical protein
MAMTFDWHDDPNSDFDGSQVVRDGTPGIPGSDSITYTNFQVHNTSDHALADVGVFIPFAWAGVPAAADPNGPILHYESLSWDNSLNGFVSGPNFNNTGESVLLTATFLSYPNDSVEAGSIADTTDTHIFSPNSASARPGIPVSARPLETFNAKDLLPFTDLGGFNPGETKQFDMTWTAHWDGADLGAVRVGGYGASLAPDVRHAGTTSTVETQNLFSLG